MISIVIDPDLDYPDAQYYFSPDEPFPEYPFTHLSEKKNPIYRAVRRCLSQAGLDQDHFDTPLWNPLGDFIRPGEKVFVLCNFANERREDESVADFRSRCTHGSVIRAIIDYVLIAAGKNTPINFGNAPTQFCHWEQVLKDTGADYVQSFYKMNGRPVEACDLRLFITDETRIGAVRGVERRDEALGVHINLGPDSLLSQLDREPVHRYRVINYDPTRTEAFHSDGVHEYVVSRKILDADVIFNIPKLKTHEKVGISCALKGYVGTVVHKDSLPHHRFGSLDMGGDEYPSDRLGTLRLLSAYHEWVHRIPPDARWGSPMRVTYRVMKRAVRQFAPVIEGAWWGNDTAWRMVLDLVRIATHASATGEMQDQSHRKHLALIDGIYGGENEGPAYSTAIRSGVLLFGDNLPSVDTLNALVMGFDPEKIPLIREAFCLAKYPVSLRGLSDEKITYNERLISLEDLRTNPPYRFHPSDGWKTRLA